MSQRLVPARAVTCFLLCWSFSSIAGGVDLPIDLTLNAYTLHREPIVRSYAKAVLYNDAGERIYNAQVILGHQVDNRTTGFPIYGARIVTEIGLANNTTRELSGEHEHCYTATAGVHVNAYGIHEIETHSERCIPAPIPEISEENCPVILDLELDGFHLSGAAPSVAFDIDADGTPDRIAWTKAGEDEAFLCLDRNGNGTIDDGTELFGYATPLLSGRRARVGYRALADLDEPKAGGNRDGKVDAGDPMFQDLCAWVDENRDGVSQAQEIYALDEVGVLALEYRYLTIHLEDSFGNLFRYVSSVKMRTPSGAVRAWPTFDVIFTEP